MSWKKIDLPLGADTALSLNAGDLLLMSGVLYTARDKAHERLCAMFRKNEPLPFDVQGAVIYYVGPAPAPAAMPSGSAGPTTSYRMDPFTECILEMGVSAMIGKGKRDGKTRKLLAEYGSIYLSSFGGAGAYLAKRIIESELIAFEDLGPEGIYRLEVKDFPAVVINDTKGRDLYENPL